MVQRTLYGVVGVALLTVLLGLTGCLDQGVDVRINADVRTNQGDPVAKAEILIGNEVIGVTDSNGRLAAAVKLSANSEQRLEVRKDSDEYYFAPFYQTLAISDAAIQDVPVAATMYFVPKPKPTVAEEMPVADEAPEIVEDPLATAEPDQEADVVNLSSDSDRALLLGDESPETTSLGEPAEELAEPATPDAEEPAGQSLAEQLPESFDPPPTEGPIARNTEVQELTADASTAGFKVKLSPANPEAPALIPEANYPKKGLTKAAEPKDTVFTIHVVSGKKPVADVQVLTGEKEKGDLREACVTNARGRCVVRYKEAPKSSVTFVARKQGFKTASVARRITADGNLRMQLEPGQTIDVFAITRSYNYTKGLSGVEVLVNGKSAGNTDPFGRLSHIYTGKPDDLVTVTLKPRGYLPEVFETDFVASGPMSLVRYFTPTKPPPVSMVVVPARLAGRLKAAEKKLFEGELDRKLTRAARKHIFASTSFREFPLSIFDRDAKDAGLSRERLIQDGWIKTDLKAKADAVLRPTLVRGGEQALELMVIDANGRVLAAAKTELAKVDDQGALDRAAKVLAKKISRVFPFEGAVLDKRADRVLINLGYASGRGVKPGDRLDVFGVQLGKLGRSVTHKKIAQLVVREVMDEMASCDVSNLVPRATIERGDQVVLNVRSAPGTATAQFQVTGPNGQVDRANIYLNDRWLGATDDDGRLYTSLVGSGQLRVIKHGFQDWAKAMAVKKGQKYKIAMRRETAFLRVASEPASAVVRLDGKEVGRTPLSSPIPVPSGFIKLEIEGPVGYKSFSQVLELDQETLDLTGAQTVMLERDVRAEAARLISKGQTQEAAEMLNAVAATHSDYLLTQHDLGELYLMDLKQPDRAAGAFANVTNDPAVQNFNDKRFIGSHINEGIALYLTAEQLAGADPKTAAAHYQKAIEVLDRVTPQIRFVPKGDFAQAVHNVEFHRALSHQKLWALSQNPVHLSQAVRTWRTYLEGSARSVPLGSDEGGYVENAEVFYKQALATLESQKDVSAQ